MNSRTIRVVAAIAAVVIVLGVLILRTHKPIEEDETSSKPAERRSVAIAADVIAGEHIQIAQAGPATIGRDLSLPGTIALNEEAVAHLVPRLSGIARDVLVHLGDRVKKGEVLAVFDSEQLANMRGEWLNARDQAQLARVTFEREEMLWNQKVTAEQDYLAAKQALQQADTRQRSAAQKLQALQLPLKDSGDLVRYELRAPIAGEIVERNVVIGEPTAPDKTVFVIADLDDVWAEFQVPGQDLAQVHEGQMATVSVEGSSLSGSGPVAHVSSVFGQDTRTAHAHLVLPNPEKRWHPGALVTIALAGPRRDVPVGVPVDAVQTVNAVPCVLVRTATGFEARDVVTGERDGQTVEIKSGLSAGESYAANAFVLKADLEKGAAD